MSKAAFRCLVELESLASWMLPKLSSQIILKYVFFLVYYHSVSIDNRSRRKFRINYFWLIPFHYGIVATLPEVLYLPHARTKYVSHRGPCLCCAVAAGLLNLPCCWGLHIQLVLLFAENLVLHMEFIGLVLSDPRWEGRPELGGKLQAWPQSCLSSKLRL